MARNDRTSAVIDGILKLLAAGTFVSTVLLAPNAVQALDKPFAHLFKKLDKRAREREIRRILAYMKSRGLIKLTADNYEHGIVLTEKGKRRAEHADFVRLEIAKPKKWDKHWRLVLFDIPERSRKERVSFTRKLRQLGFQQLQQSAWVHPYPCREEIEIVTHYYGLSRYVSYLETNGIDNQQRLLERFKNQSK